MTQLRSCPGCSRHVLSSELACPFCQCSLDAAPERAQIKVPANLSRAQRLALAAAMAGQAISACAKTTDPIGPAVPIYGAPLAGNVAPAAGSGSAGTGQSLAGRNGGQAGTTLSAPAYGLPPLPDAGFGTPVYGAPIAGQPGKPVDAGVAVDSGADDDDAGPTSDAGTRKDGGAMVQPLYGAPIPIYGAPIPKK